MTIVTRCENEDNFKVYKVCETFKNPKTYLEILSDDQSDAVIVTFTTTSNKVKYVEKTIALLNELGVKSEIK